ncbi:MAG: hypothetical protein ACE5OS_10885 [Anaerolineae bacterium]
MSQLTNQPTNHPSITLETVLWALIALIALALRLSHLDAAPLNVREAREAMLAWRSVTGQGMPQADYSPLLFAANALLFALCGAGDGLARLWPALFGSALALTPLLLRRRIGRVGALVTGTYLAFSPTALFASRQLDGAVVAAVGGMVLLGGLARFFDTERRPWLTLSAGGLALAVTSSPSAYGLLLALGLAWLGLAWAWPGKHVSRLTFHVSHSFLVFLLTALALSTGLGWNLSGLGAAGDLLPAWIARFGPVSNPAPSALTIIAIYEPLALLFGLGGLVGAIRRVHRFGALLGMWAGLEALLLTLMPGRVVLDTLWVILPLAMLTGIAMEWLVQSLRRWGAWLGEGLYVPVVLILWVHTYLVLARYAERGIPTDLVMVLLVAILQVLLATIFALAMRFDAALRGVVVGTGILLLALTLSAGWRVAYVRPADPREPLVREPTAVEVRDLVRTLRDLSWHETGIPTVLPFTFEAAPDSVLAWYLRDFSAARRVESVEEAEETDRVLVTSRRDLELTGDVAFAGQDFALRRSWNLAEIGCTWEWPPHCNAAVKWLLLRRAPSLPVADQWAVLWLRQDMVETGD